MKDYEDDDDDSDKIVFFFLFAYGVKFHPRKCQNPSTHNKNIRNRNKISFSSTFSFA